MRPGEPGAGCQRFCRTRPAQVAWRAALPVLPFSRLFEPPPPAINPASLSGLYLNTISVAVLMTSGFLLWDLGLQGRLLPILYFRMLELKVRK